jgi:hypothetical protein
MPREKPLRYEGEENPAAGQLSAIDTGSYSFNRQENYFSLQSLGSPL